MRKLRENLPNDEVLSRMLILYRDSRFAELRREWDERLRRGRAWRGSAANDTGCYIAPVEKGSPPLSRRMYQLTRKGKEVAQWRPYHSDRITRVWYVEQNSAELNE